MKRLGGIRRHAITSRADFRRIFRHGRAVKAPHLMAHVASGASEDLGRLAVVVSRKQGSAVLRNRIRRRIREVVRTTGGPPAGVDTILVARPGAGRLSYEEIKREVDQIMEEITKNLVPGDE